MNTYPTESLLAALGYEVRWPRRDIPTCMVFLDDEVWVGHGLDRERALANALHQMCPSSAALRAWDALCRDAMDNAPSHREAILTIFRGLDGPAHADLHHRPLLRAMARFWAVEGSSPLPLSHLHEQLDGASVEDALLSLTKRFDRLGLYSSFETASSDGAVLVPADPFRRALLRVFTPDLLRDRTTPRFPADAPVTPADLREGLGRLEEIRSDVEEARPRVSLYAPRLQRLYLTWWAAQVRSVTEGYVHDPRLASPASRSIKSLANLTAQWWPGTVLALRASAEPWGAAWKMVTEDVSTWRELAHASERRIFMCEGTSPEAGGWADTAPREPPARPRAALRVAVAYIGPFAGDVADPRSKPVLPPAEAAPHLIEAACLLRWCRFAGAEIDRTLWAAAFGRLRWIVWSAPRFDPVLRALTRSTFDLCTEGQRLGLPGQTWAQVCSALAGSQPDPAASENRGGQDRPAAGTTA